MNNVVISIIIATYNSEKTLEKAILSVIQQSYSHIELIIIDGASKDKTIEIIKQYSSKIKFWESKKDDGVYHALNKATSIANGDFIYFLGSDDQLFCRTTIENFVKKINNLYCIYYGNVLLKQKNIYYDKKFYLLKLLNRNISHQSIFYPKCCYRNFKYNTKYPIYADYAFNLQQYKLIPFKYINLPIAIYNETGLSKIEDRIFLQEKDQIIKSIYGNYLYYFYILISPLQKIHLKLKEVYYNAVRNFYINR